MRKVKVITVLNEVKHVHSGQLLKEISIQCTEGLEHKHFHFWATDDELERLGDRLHEIAGVEYEDDPEQEPEVPTGPGSRLLQDKEPENLHRALGKFGCKEHYTFASEVLERRVTSFTTLTVASSFRIYEAALKRYGTPQQQEEYAQRRERAEA